MVGSKVWKELCFKVLSTAKFRICDLSRLTWTVIDQGIGRLGLVSIPVGYDLGGQRKIPPGAVLAVPRYCPGHGWSAS